MEENDKKSKEQIKVIKDQEETLGNDQLENVEGGGTECVCDCWNRNTNSDKDKQETLKPSTSDDKVL